jgi:two-component system nitrate/nitrite response regulator NarL
MQAGEVTVILADAHREHASTIRESLEEAGIAVVAEAADADEALELALELQPTVCVIDMQAGERAGLGTAAVVARVLGATSVVLVAEELTVADVLDALRAGVAGCVSRAAGGDGVAAAVLAAAAGEAAFPRRELRQALGFLVPQVA